MSIFIPSNVPDFILRFLLRNIFISLVRFHFFFHVFLYQTCSINFDIIRITLIFILIFKKRKTLRVGKKWHRSNRSFFRK